MIKLFSILCLATFFCMATFQSEAYIRPDFEAHSLSCDSSSSHHHHKKKRKSKGKSCCKRGKRGATGPTGAAGAAGPAGAAGAAGATGAAGSLTTSYISSYATAPQSVGTTPADVLFSNDQTTNETITHPDTATFSDFTVTVAGVYQVAWTIVLSSAGTETNSLTLLVNDTVVEPEDIQANMFGTGGGIGNLSGSYLIDLNAGDFITLSIVSTVDGEVNINNRTISIFLIEESLN